MEIPLNFYIRFWVKNTATAAVAGLVFGYPFIGISPFIMIVLPLFFITFYQFKIIQHFIGKYRGYFEFQFREAEIHLNGSNLLRGIMRFSEYLKLRFEEIGYFIIERVSIYKTLLDKDHVKSDPRKQFYILMRLAKSAWKEGNYESEILYLNEALKFQPNDIVALFRLGNSYEKIGRQQDAINSYNQALNFSHIKTDQLKKYINDQIERIHKKGPCIRPPVPGLRLMLY